tara:strand:- start:2570 stop:2965 length:396 start_codon:yes stop_codon:yes gene_type:complete
MADKSSINKAFNKLIISFLDDIISIFPEQEDIATAKTSLLSFKQMNPSILIKSWYKLVYTPYAQVIDAGDVNFFFEKDYSSDLENIPNGKEFMKMIDKVRAPINTMDATNRGHCADYILKLSKLSEMYSSM